MSSQSPRRNRRSARTPEGTEDELISLSQDLVRKRLIDGTASSQETTTLLKWGSRRDALERKRLEHEIMMLSAKREEIADRKNLKTLFEDAIASQRMYSGHGDEEEYERDQFYDEDRDEYDED